MDNNPVVSETATSGNNSHSANIDMLLDVPLTVTIELGRTEMTLKQALELNQGSVIELSRLAGDPIDVYVNERLIARGEVVVVDDKFAVRITELFSNTPKPNGQGDKA